jgi:drug/metabolite transporter (DMT)-like permease
VLVVPFMERFALGRRVLSAAWAGVALAVVGLLLLTRPFGEGTPAAVRLGDLLTLGCAVAYAGQIVLTGRWSPRHPLVPFVFAQVATTLAGVVALALLEGPRLDLARPGPLVGTVAYTGVVMTAGAFFVMAWAQRHTTPVRAALLFSLEPVAAALFSHFYAGEALGPWDLAGGGLIVLGVVLGEVGGAIQSGRATPEPPA